MTRNKELIVPRGMEASKMSWMALPVEPACMGKKGGGSEASAHVRWIGWTNKITYKHVRRYEY
jgi:hypothetical protein